MIKMLDHHVNKIVMVSIPSMFGDDEPRNCRLVGVEVPGLWLESQEFSGALAAPDAHQHLPAVFVPFTQIVYLIGAEVPPSMARNSSEEPSSRPARTVSPKPKHKR